jgi:Right handed beta helix region
VRFRAAMSIGVLLVVAAVVVLGRWYAAHRTGPALTQSALNITVTSSGDRGPGTLREALFVADAAPAQAHIEVRVSSIRLESALPPIVNPRGTRIEGPAAGLQIDASALAAGGPVLDVDGADTDIDGLTIAHCSGTAILVRAARFRLSGSTIQSCDVGVEVAPNAGAVAVENDRFESNHVGIRFSGPSRDSLVVKNEFAGNTTAGMWLVAATAGSAADPITVRSNQFSSDGTDVVVGNVAVILEQNDFTAVRDAAVHIIGADAVVRNNRVSGGAAAGVVAENARGAVIDGNEVDHLAGYGILVRGSASTLVRGNRIHSCAYGMAFVLGDPQRPNSAIDNSLIDLKYNGIDVIGESPILRHNQVLQARVMPLHVENFVSASGSIVRAQPLLESNSFQSTPAVAIPTAAVPAAPGSQH